MTRGGSPFSGRFPNFGREMKKTLMWNKGERESSSAVKMSQILNQVLRFQLISHKTGTSLLHLGMENIQRLEYCQVRNCPAMETIVVERNGPSTSTTNVTGVFLNLKALGLHSLPNLRSICEDPRHRFTKLTKLVIRECPKLSSCVFTQGMIQHMPNLEELDVWDCEGIEEIVMREDVEETNHHHLQLIFFPKLISLRLVSCQNLVRIWKGASQPWPSIQEIYITHCPNLENLNLNAVDDKNPLAELEFIDGEEEWWEALKWEDENSKNRLQPLFVINRDQIQTPTPFCHQPSSTDIKVECLSKEEAWNLFRAKAGDVVDSSSIESIARDVLEECGGLPLAVVVIGTSLRGVEDVYVWLDALKQLKSATPQSDDTELYLFERLKWSYDRLKDVERECFLYCALYPKDYVIPVAELVTLWGLEGFTFRGDMDSSERLDDADASGHRIVNNLVDSSLLERTKGDGVKMHDVLRDLALWIASSKFLVRADLGIKECPYDEKKWQEARRISLMKNELSGGLPTNPRCNALATLLLHGNYYLEYIPDMFFQHMPSLRVLDLSYTDIKVLPASVSNLVNLRGLYVIVGNPVDLPREIGALEKLEVLHVSVGSLPLEVRQLTSLRRLWVEFWGVEAMRTICSNGVVSSLSLLEDLRICFRNDYFGNLRREWCKVVDDSRVGEEVGRLKRLTRLQFDFSTIECFEHFLLQQQRNTNSCSFPGFKDFHLSMTRGGSTGFDFPRFEGEMKKTLMWNKGEGEASSEVKMSQILNQVLRFQLKNHETGTSLLHLGMENIQRLEYCEVRNCPAMETIVVESNLPNLKELELSDLPNLRSICEDPRHRFTKLTELRIMDCSKLSSCVFTQGMIQHMPNLEVLHVGYCEGIEEIVMREDVEETNHHHLQLIFFPKLRVLRLRYCQNLVRIWKGASQPWPSIQEIEVYDCPNLENLNLNLNLNLNAVDDKNPLAALEFIIGKREWWEALKWEDENFKNRLQPLFKHSWA